MTGTKSGMAATKGSRIGVRMVPGLTALMRIPFAAYSKAAARVSQATPCLPAMQAAAPGVPTNPQMEALLTMAPPPCASMRGISQRMHCQTPFGADEIGGAACGADEFRRLLAGLRIHVRGDYRGSFPGEGERGRPPDARAAPRDESNLAFQCESAMVRPLSR